MSSSTNSLDCSVDSNKIDDDESNGVEESCDSDQTQEEEDRDLQKSTSQSSIVSEEAIECPVEPSATATPTLAPEESQIAHEDVIENLPAQDTNEETLQPVNTMAPRNDDNSESVQSLSETSSQGDSSSSQSFESDSDGEEELPGRKNRIRGFGDGLLNMLDKWSGEPLTEPTTPTSPYRTRKSSDDSNGVLASYANTPQSSLAISNQAEDEQNVQEEAKVEEKQEDTSQEKAKTVSTLSFPFLGKAKTTIASPTASIDQDGDLERAHEFRSRTYQTPTHCDICKGLLVGLWNQGLQCGCCGMNVHHGQGQGDHDDCRAEALLSYCRVINDTDNDKSTQKHLGSHTAETSQEDSAEKKNRTGPLRLRQTLEEVRALAKSSPNFLKEVREQIDRDVKSHAKKLVVQSGAEEQRSKNFRRLREKLVPILAHMDALAEKGRLYSLCKVLFYHAVLAGAVSILAVAGFGLALVPTRNGVRLAAALGHTSTVLTSFHVTIVCLACLARHLAWILKRKQLIIDQFLRDYFTVRAETDIGCSVADAASRAQYWSNQFLLSSLLSCGLAAALWYKLQENHEAMVCVW